MGTCRLVAERHLSDDELKAAIKKTDDEKVVRRLCFVRNLYAGDSVAEAAARVGTSYGTGRLWLHRWNEEDPAGLILRFGGGRPPKLSHQESRHLQQLLEEGQPWTTGEIMQLIEDEFRVSFHPNYLPRLLRSVYKMSYAIPRPETPSRPENADEILAERLDKALSEQDMRTNEEDDKEAADPGETIVGFFRSSVADADGKSASALGLR
jgi:transposase